MKNIKLATIILLLAVIGLHAADAPTPTFPEVGTTYILRYADAGRTESGFTKAVDTIILRIEQILPSGWIYATEIKRTYVADPSDASKVKFTDEDNGAAWYNLQSFARAVKIKKAD